MKALIIGTTVGAAAYFVTASILGNPVTVTTAILVGLSIYLGSELFNKLKWS